MNMQLTILMYLALDLEYHHQMENLIVEILKYINKTYTYQVTPNYSYFTIYPHCVATVTCTRNP